MMGFSDLIFGLHGQQMAHICAVPASDQRFADRTAPLRRRLRAPPPVGSLEAEGLKLFVLLSALILQGRGIPSHQGRKMGDVAELGLVSLKQDDGIRAAVSCRAMAWELKMERHLRRSRSLH